jgi:SAM-dependent methyltransferase
MQPANVVGLPDAHGSAQLLADARAQRLATYDRVDRERYAALAHVPACLEEIGVAGRRVLEVGMGDGAEAEQLVRSGARLSGLDIDAAVVAAVAARLKDRELTYDALRHGDVSDLPWPDHSFDVVFSHGLLDRVDDLARAQSELHRVLRPGGQLVVMVRARRSWRYQLTVRVQRRAAVLVRYPFVRLGAGRSGPARPHLERARAEGLRAALDADALLDWGGDADRAPRRVFTRREVAEAFGSFTVSRTHQHHGPRGLRSLDPVLGWHLWVHLTPK